MTYSESAKGIRIDERRVAVELARHGLHEPYNLAAFKEDCPAGKDGKWKVSDVLDWLGY